MVASHGLVGPIPPGAEPTDYDRTRRRALWHMPSGLYLLGARAGGVANLMTLNWATQVSTDPKLVAIGVQTDALTHRLVSGSGAFAVSILHRRDRALVRSFVKPAAFDEGAGTIGGHPVRAATTGAPILTAALAWIDCRVHHRLDCGTHTLFVGQVEDAGESTEEVAGGDVEVLRMEDTRMSYGG